MKELPSDLEQLMNDVDSDGSGVIDYTEFVAATLDKRQYIQVSRLMLFLCSDAKDTTLAPTAGIVLGCSALGRVKITAALVLLVGISRCVPLSTRFWRCA